MVAEEPMGLTAIVTNAGRAAQPERGAPPRLPSAIRSGRREPRQARALADLRPGHRIVAGEGGNR
jgi:hypothetical protein